MRISSRWTLGAALLLAFGCAASGHQARGNAPPPEEALTRQDPAFIEAEVSSATAGLTSMEKVLGSIDLPAFDAMPSGPAPELLTLGPPPIPEERQR